MLTKASICYVGHGFRDWVSKDIPNIHDFCYGSMPQPVGASFSAVEHTFTPSSLSAGEWASITGRCASIVRNGSGFGICNSCKAGALGGSKQ